MHANTIYTLVSGLLFLLQQRTRNMNILTASYAHHLRGCWPAHIHRSIHYICIQKIWNEIKGYRKTNSLLLNKIHLEFFTYISMGSVKAAKNKIKQRLVHHWYCLAMRIQKTSKWKTQQIRKIESPPPPPKKIIIIMIEIIHLPISRTFLYNGWANPPLNL